MPFTSLFALFALLGLGVVFVVIYRRNGMKAAMIATGITLVIFAVLFEVILNVIVSAM